MTEPIPDDTKVRRTWVIAGVLAVVVVLVAVGAGLAVLARRGPAPVQQGTYTPLPAGSSLPSTPTTAAPGGVVPSSTPTQSVQPTPTALSPAKPAVRRGRIAFRLNGRVYVADEDGSNAVPVVSSTVGAFSLSPDGRTLVVMKGATTDTDYAVLVDVATKSQIPLVSAVELPSWSADSSWLAYTAKSSMIGRYSIHRVNRDGSNDWVVISSAADPQISPDGAYIAHTVLPISESSTQSLRSTT